LPQARPRPAGARFPLLRGPRVRSTSTTNDRPSRPVSRSRRGIMSMSRILRVVVGTSAMVFLAACGAGGSGERATATPTPAAAASAGDPITGRGLPNPAPKIIRNWGELPAGRKWGTTAGIDIDPLDGNVWAYERCGAGAAAGAGGGPVDCETN